MADWLAPTACAQPGNLFVDRAALSFEYVMGGLSPAPQTIGITSNGFLTFTVSNIFNSPWLMVRPVSGVTPATLQVVVDATGLSAGVYDAQLQISAENVNSPPPVKIRLTVYDLPKLIVSPASLSFAYQAGQAVPLSQSLYVTASAKPVRVAAAISGASGWN